MDLITEALSRAKQFEGFSSVPYQCPADVWTIGYGTNLQRRNFPPGVILILGPILAANINTGCSVGRNWTGLVVTKETAEALARANMDACMTGLAVELSDGFSSPVGSDTRLHNKPYGARLVLLDMAYNMGVPALLGFKKMFAALDAGDWDRAAIELLDSRYGRKLPERAGSNADLLRGLGVSDMSMGQQLDLLRGKVEAIRERMDSEEVP